jgi:acyl-CoA thioester hydrolase
VSAAAIVVERVVEWADTDASGHAHNSLATRLLESAEWELMRRAGLAALVPSMPRVRIAFDFRERLYAGDQVAVELRLGGMGRTSLTWEMTVRTGAGAVAITGEAVVVHAPGPAAEPWPEEVRGALGAEALSG